MTRPPTLQHRIAISAVRYESSSGLTPSSLCSAPAMHNRVSIRKPSPRHPQIVTTASKLRRAARARLSAIDRPCRVLTRSRSVAIPPGWLPRGSLAVGRETRSLRSLVPPCGRQRGRRGSAGRRVGCLNAVFPGPTPTCIALAASEVALGAKQQAPNTTLFFFTALRAYGRYRSHRGYAPRSASLRSPPTLPAVAQAARFAGVAVRQKNASKAKTPKPPQSVTAPGRRALAPDYTARCLHCVDIRLIWPLPLDKAALLIDRCRGCLNRFIAFLRHSIGLKSNICSIFDRVFSVLFKKSVDIGNLCAIIKRKSLFERS